MSQGNPHDGIAPEECAVEVKAPIHGNGSIAHQIIGKFLDDLEKEPEYSEIHPRLKMVLFGAKPTEASLRTALFGELEL